jgi:hypothetical protein
MISTFKVCSWVCSVTAHHPRVPRPLAHDSGGSGRGSRRTSGDPLQLARVAIFHIALIHSSVRCRTETQHSSYFTCYAIRSIPARNAAPSRLAFGTEQYSSSGCGSIFSSRGSSTAVSDQKRAVSSQRLRASAQHASVQYSMLRTPDPRLGRGIARQGVQWAPERPITKRSAFLL